jgi:hypothetical protein
MVNMKKTVRFDEKATKFKIPDNPQDNVTREYLSLNDVKKTPCPSATLTAVPVKKTAVKDMKDQFLRNMNDMGLYKVPIEQISSATLTAVPLIARSVKKTPCPSDTLTAVPDMKTQFLMLYSKR